MAQIFFASDADPAMQEASRRARESFRYLWRELSWEYRRIIPALDMSGIKVAFRDPPGTPLEEGAPEAEQMWVGELDFDGKLISGKLLNTPNWLHSVTQGQRVEVPIEGITDWIYAQGGRAYGAFTVHEMRKGMSTRERAEHDAAWGFEFGDPSAPMVLPARYPPPPYPPPPADHPMSINMAPSVREAVQKNRALLNEPDERGFTMLHSLALAGSAIGVSTPLEEGADRTLRTRHGMTARDLAATLSWDPVLRVLDR